jgi:hypothetical protein
MRDKAGVNGHRWQSGCKVIFRPSCREGLFPLSQGKRAALVGANQAKEFCGNLPINVAFRDYLLPLKEQEEDQSLFAKVGQG